MWAALLYSEFKLMNYSNVDLKITIDLYEVYILNVGRYIAFLLGKE